MVITGKSRSSEKRKAQVAELVDALVSGTSIRKGVQVRVLFWALKNSDNNLYCKVLLEFYFLLLQHYETFQEGVSQKPPFAPPTRLSLFCSCNFWRFLSIERSVIPINSANSGIVIWLFTLMYTRIFPDVFPDVFLIFVA